MALSKSKGLKMAMPKLKQILKKIGLAGSFLILQSLFQLAGAETSESLVYNLSIEDNQNLYEGRDYDKVHSTDFGFTPKYSQGDFSYSAAFSVSHQNNLQQDTTLANTNISIARKPFESFLGTEWKPAMGLNVSLPTDEEQKRSSHYRGGLGLRGSLGRSLAFFGLPLEVLYALSGNKNFHEFDLSAEGTPLIEYSLKNRLGLDLSLTEKFTLSLLFDYINGLTYRRSPREKFSANLESSYELSKKISASFGVATEGNAKKSNDFDSNVSFFNDNTSVIHTGVSFLF
jgi:hypothetical protein